MGGGSNVDGDESGGTSPSRQGADTGILVPRSLSAMAAEIGIASREKGSGIRVCDGRINRSQRGHRGGPQGSQEGVRRALGGAAPATLLGPWWVHSLPSLVIWEASGTLSVYIIFLEFIWHF